MTFVRDPLAVPFGGLIRNFGSCRSGNYVQLKKNNITTLDLKQNGLDGAWGRPHYSAYVLEEMYWGRCTWRDVA